MTFNCNDSTTIHFFAKELQQIVTQNASYRVCLSQVPAVALNRCCCCQVCDAIGCERATERAAGRRPGGQRGSDWRDPETDGRLAAAQGRDGAQGARLEGGGTGEREGEEERGGYML